MSTAMGPGVRLEHEERVLAALRDHGARSRAELGDLVGLSRSSLSEVAASLLDRGAIVVLGKDSDTRRGAGRPAERLALDPNSGQYLGLDFQHARVDVAIADATRTVLGTGTTPYDLGAPWHERILIAFDLIEDVARTAHAHFGALAWIYAGIPGPYVPPSARVTLPAFGEQSRIDGYGVRGALSGRFNVPTTIDNNTRLAALAEASAGGATDLVYIRLGQGVGGGLVQGGRLTRGSHQLAGELGHAPVPGHHEPCRCGKRGCLEMIAAMPAVLQAFERQGISVGSTGGPRHEAAVADLTATIAEALSAILKPVIMAIDPEEVVLAGPVLDLLPGLLQRATDGLVAEHLTRFGVPRVRGPLVNGYEGALGALIAGYGTQIHPVKGMS